MTVRRLGSVILPLLMLVACDDPAREPTAPENSELSKGKSEQREGVRFSTFNASLNRNSTGELIGNLSGPNNQQARNVAETIQRTRPDVILINEFDFDDAGTSARLHPVRSS